MIFSKDMLFIHVPKTGGMSITRYLLEALPKPVYYSNIAVDETIADPLVVQIPGIRHETLDEAKEIMAHYGFDISCIPLILAVIRNPYDLEVSRYSYLQKEFPWDKGRNQELAVYEDFEAFVIQSFDHAGPTRPIERYFLLDGCVPPNLKIIRMENLSSGMRETMSTIGIEMVEDLPKRNASCHDHFLSYYTKGAEEAVYQRYKWVFDSGLYSRIDPDTLIPERMAPSHKIPITSSVRQVRRSSGLWHDSWVGDTLRFKVRAKYPINRITIEGSFPHEFDKEIDFILVINGQQNVTSLEANGSFEWKAPCSIKPDTTADIELKSSAVFCPKDIGQSEDTRQLSFLLHRVVFDYDPLDEEAEVLQAVTARRERKLFERLAWQKDRMLLDELVFRLEHRRSEDWELGEECFRFYKLKGLVDAYARFWRSREEFHPRNIFEIGIWDGGSVVFWFEWFHPQKHVAIDIASKGDSEYFQRYVRSRDLESRIKNYWGVDQADSQRLLEIVDREFAAPLDLVIDDGSHLYGPTKSSFETLFPLLRPGGLYIIEDWAWEHWEAYQSPDHPRAKKQSLTELIFQLVEATGSSHVIERLTIFRGFAVVERGSAGAAQLSDFKLERHISRRPGTSERPIIE